MQSKLLIILIVLTLMITLMSCSNETSKTTENNNDTVIAQNEDKEDKQIIAQIETDETITKADIDDNLKNDESVMEIVWSKDSSVVAFTRDIGDYQLQLYIWVVDVEAEERVLGVDGNLYDISWSSNDEYVTVNEGTSTMYNATIVSIKDISIVDNVVCVAGPVWSPDSTQIVFAVLNDKMPSVAVEWDGTSDLVLYELENKKQEIIVEARNDYYYIPNSWNNEGIVYSKYYFDDRKSEELLYEFNK